jgi:purine-nucleoside phosphorylase
LSGSTLTRDISKEGIIVMSEFIKVEEIELGAKVIQDQINRQPKVGIILGSGLGSLAEAVENAVVIPYRDIPSWPISTVEGHQGRLVIGSLEGQEVLVMQGRSHFYEGYSMTQVGFPVRVMQQLGLEILIVTNAAGAVNPEFEPGDVMLITDHLNLLGMAGASPLRGPNLDHFGPRFPDMGLAYDKELSALARQVAEDNKFPLREGVYICLAGPSFETPADLRFLKSIGVDAVGMSTVPEVTVARHGGMRALGLSTISNKANLDGSTITSHEEVLAAGKIVLPRLTHIIKGVLQRL